MSTEKTIETVEKVAEAAAKLGLLAAAWKAIKRALTKRRDRRK